MQMSDLTIRAISYLLYSTWNTYMFYVFFLFIVRFLGLLRSVASRAYLVFIKFRLRQQSSFFSAHKKKGIGGKILVW